MHIRFTPLSAHLGGPAMISRIAREMDPSEFCGLFRGALFWVSRRLHDVD